MEIQFIEIFANQIPQLRQLALALFTDTYKNLLSKEQIDYMLDMMYSERTLIDNFKEGCHFYLVEFDGKYIGYGSLSAKEEVATLHKIYLDSQYQGKNLGKKFIEFLEKEAIALGATSMQLYVNRQNTAQYFYEKMGFKILNKLDKDIGGGYFMNDYLMEKGLK